MNIDRVREIKSILVPNRIMILELLLNKDTCVCEMVYHFKLRHNLVSHHLKVLQEMGYISSIRNGQHIIYHLEDSKRDTVKEIFKLLNI